MPVMGVAMSRGVELNFEFKFYIVLCPKHHRKVLAEPIKSRFKVLLSEKSTDTLVQIVESKSWLIVSIF